MLAEEEVEVTLADEEELDEGGGEEVTDFLDTDIDEAREEGGENVDSEFSIFLAFLLGVVTTSEEAREFERGRTGFEQKTVLPTIANIDNAAAAVAAAGLRAT